MWGAKVFAVATLAVIFAGAATTFAQTYSVLYNFNPNVSGPLQGVLAQGRDANLYGTTLFRYGIFRFTPTGTPTPLDNGTPFAGWGVTLGIDGNFYGAAQFGGTHTCGSGSCGILFKMTQGGVVTTFHDFTGLSDGAYPYYPPIEGSDGNFYGMTQFGGNTAACALSGVVGGGVVYKITPAGTFTTLHKFNGADGCFPQGELVQGRDGNFYGTTFGAGCPSTCGDGTIFRVSATGSFKVLHYFNIVGGPQKPSGPLIQASDGNLYGTAQFGGNAQTSGGTVFKMTPSGTVTVIHNFPGTSGDGIFPIAGVAQATDGNLYGTTQQGGTGTCHGGPNSCGTLFRMSLAGANYVVLHNFTGTTGASPDVPLFQHTNGSLYGGTHFDGTNSDGVFYRLSAGLHAFVSLMTLSGKAGQTVEILGQGLTGTTSVKFGSGAATFTVVSDTYMTAVVPATGTTANATLATPSGPLVSSKVFRVIPTIASFTPTSGKIGTSVIITGTGLTQTSKVTFGGITATTFTINLATKVMATVPNGAKTGKIGITTPGGIATSAGTFRVTPVISGFNPTSGAPGTSVVITGSGLRQTTKVTFGGIAATTFTVNSDTKVTATVPPGAVTGKIAITTPGGTATSVASFTVI
ncbi:MAG: hypothetical protein DMG89_14705 [Acidobacteria bacterium]|nr:MAG: hypothetical protein DMG89_14705 [Acidobacteriota bacterium]